MVSSRKYLFFSVFIAGMTTLAVEFTASRMLQTIFGSANIVWANVIGLVLFFLTVGYFIGGRIADKNPKPILFYWLVTFAGIASIVSLLMTSILLRETTSKLAAINAGAVISSFIGVLMAIAIPITLLGCLSPFAIRLGVRNIEESGRISGRIYAISTWGSLLGTYLPVLWVIPTAGSRMTAVIFGSILITTGLIGVWREGKNKKETLIPTVGCLFLIPFIIYGTQGKIKDNPNQIFETESQYNYLEVKKIKDCYSLYLNEGAMVHSEWCENNRVDRYSVYAVMSGAPLFSKPDTLKKVEEVAVIGLGAGTLPKRFISAFGDMNFDGIEIDPIIVDLGRKYFDMNEPSLNVIIGDGRYELNRLTKNYDVIALDAYKPPYIPWHLTTVEFFQEIKSKLKENGVITINTYRPQEDRRLVRALCTTLSEVFDSIYTVDVGGYNTVIFATNQNTDFSFVRTNYQRFKSKDNVVLQKAYQKINSGLVETEVSNILFTDEIAPVEPLIDSILFRMIVNHTKESGS